MSGDIPNTDHWLVVFLNGSVLCLGFILKVPQIMRVLNRGTTEGISLYSLTIEFWVFNNLFAYPFAMGYPVLGYSEFLVLSIQDAILLFLVCRERKLINIKSVSMFVVYLSVMVGLANGYLDRDLHKYLCMLIAPISATGKITQLVTIVRNKSSGSVSPVTWTLAVYTPTAKLITNIMTVYDKPLMLVSTQGMILNGCICLATLVYRDAAPPSKTKTH